MSVRSLAVVALLLGLAGGAHAQTQKQTRDRNLITADEIGPVSANSAFDVVERLRPHWLRRDQDRSPVSLGAGRNLPPEEIQTRAGDRMPEQPPRLKVFVDGTESEVQDLKRIPKEQIAELRFLAGSDAESRYGPRFAAGVVEVTLRTGR